MDQCGSYQGFVKQRLDTVVSGVDMFLFPVLKDSLQKWHMLLPIDEQDMRGWLYNKANKLQGEFGTKLGEPSI